MDRQSSFISIWLQLELCAMAVLLTKGIQTFGLPLGRVLLAVFCFEQTSKLEDKTLPAALRFITSNYLFRQQQNP